MKFKKITAILSAAMLIPCIAVNAATEKTESTVASTYNHYQKKTSYFDTLDDAVGAYTAYTNTTIDYTIYKDCNLTPGKRISMGDNSTYNIDADTDDVTITKNGSEIMFLFAGTGKLNIGTKEGRGKITINDINDPWHTFHTVADTEITFGENCIIKGVQNGGDVGSMFLNSAKVTIDGADVTGITKIDATDSAKITITGNATLPPTGITVTSANAAIDISGYTGNDDLRVIKESDCQKIVPFENVVAITTVNGTEKYHTTFKSAWDTVKNNTGTITLLKDVATGALNQEETKGDITINATEGKTVTLTCDGNNYGAFIIFSGTQMQFGINGGNLILKQGTGVTWPMITYYSSTNPIVFGPNLKIESMNEFTSSAVDLVVKGADISGLTYIKGAKSLTIKGNVKLGTLLVKTTIPVTISEGILYRYTQTVHSNDATYNEFHSIEKPQPTAMTREKFTGKYGNINLPADGTELITDGTNDYGVWKATITNFDSTNTFNVTAAKDDVIKTETYELPTIESAFDIYIMVSSPVGNLPDTVGYFIN